MLSPLWITLLIIALLESGIAIILNTYIVMAEVISIKNGLSRNPTQLIHLILGLVNIIVQCAVTVQGSLYVICPPILFIKEVYLPFHITTQTVIYCSFWFTAWLCAYYCTSITNFTYGLFLWSKRIISTSLLLLLLLSAVGSCVISVLSIWTVRVETKMQFLENSTSRSSFISGTFHINNCYMQIATFLGCVLPFTITLCSIMLTVSSLLRHVWKIKQDDSGFTRPKLQAHLNAIRTMFLFLTASIIFCTAVVMFFTIQISSSPDSMTVIIWFIIMSFPTAEAIIIIQANSKLRMTFVEKFCAVYLRNMEYEN